MNGEPATLKSGGETRSYLVDAPAVPADRPLAVVLSFHGLGSGASRHRWWVRLGTLAQREGFIAVHPEGHEGVESLGRTGRGWDMEPTATRDLEFVHALLDRLERERCVDRRRIFATGFSNGGFFVNLLGCRLAERLAAFAAVSGAAPLAGCAPSQPMSILMIHGHGDRVVKVEDVHAARDWWIARGFSLSQNAGDDDGSDDGCLHYDARGAELVYCEGPQGHIWPSDASEYIWRFFLAHPRQ